MTAELLEDAAPYKSPRTRGVDPAPDGDRLAERSVGRAMALITGLRDEGIYTVARATDTLNRQELVALVVALAALCPADTDPLEALTWIEVPPAEWPGETVLREAARFDIGHTDATALAAMNERARRQRAAVHIARSPGGVLR